MSLVIRIWLALTGVIAAVLGTLAVLSTLQHDASLSHLIRQRLAVTVETTARPFRSVVELGLPISMMRNSRALLVRAQITDPEIRDVILFNPSGIVVEHSGSGKVERLSPEVLAAQIGSAKARWGLETGSDLISGVSIRNDAGEVVGGVLAVYPKTGLETRSAIVARKVGLAAAAILLLFAGIAYVAVRARLGAILAELGGLESTLAALDRRTARPTPTTVAGAPGDGASLAAIKQALANLRDGLDAATEKYRQAWHRIGDDDTVTTTPLLAGPRKTVLIGIPERAMARSFARHLTPVIVILTLASTLMLGLVAYANISESFRPETTRRIQLIGSIATADIQRSIEAGLPIENLEGGPEYFGHLLADFPEISYFSVFTDHPTLEVGKAQTDGTNRTTFPITIGNKRIGDVVAETNLDYLATRFRDVVLDLSVVVLVILLFAFELIVVMMTLSVTGPLDRLQHLLELQIAGNFSTRLMATGRNAIERLGRVLSERAERLNAWVARTPHAGEPPDRAPPRPLDPGFCIPGSPPALMRFCSLSDVRLPLFLFAMADELPLSFFSLYTRAQANSLSWLAEGVVISLPLAAYLLAALLGAPLARPLGARLGYRRLFIVAALVTFLAKLGLSRAETVVELIVLSGVNGLAFALASLACQDYVLDMLPKDSRSRSMGLFRATLFSGIFAATALGGILADRLGQRPVFVVCALLSVASALLIWRMLPAGRPAGALQERSEAEEKLSFNILAPMRSPALAALAFGSVIPLAIVDHVYISYLLALQMDELGASISTIARVMMCFFLALIFGGYAEGRLPSRLSTPGYLLVASSILTGVLLLISAWLPSIWSTLAAAIGAGFALGLAGGPQTALVMAAAEGALAHLGSSVTLGAIRVLERGGAIIGLIAIGQLSDTTGYSGAVGIIGLAVLLGAGLFAVLGLVARQAIAHGRKV